MKTSKILAVILAAILMLTLLTANVFADEATGEAAAETTAEVAGDVTEAPEAEGTATEEDHDHEGETTEDEHDHDHEGETTEDGHDHSINWVDIIVSASILVIAALAFVICYFAIPKFREKVQKFFSDYKSELKKVTWSSKEDVRRNTITVIVVIAAVAIVIAVLDIIFSGGIEALGHLI